MSYPILLATAVLTLLVFSGCGGGGGGSRAATPPAAAGSGSGNDSSSGSDNGADDGSGSGDGSGTGGEGNGSDDSGTPSEPEDLPPIAALQVSGQGFDNQVREGSVIVLSGSTSDGQDDSLETFKFASAASNPPLVLQQTGADAVRLTVPAVAVVTPLEFELTVTDSDGVSATAAVLLSAIPARDANRFLAFDAPRVPVGRGDRFPIVVVPDSGQTPGVEPLRVQIAAELAYADRNAACAEFDGTGDTCVRFTRNASVTLPQLPALESHWSRDNAGDATETTLVAELPALVVGEVNQLLDAAGEPDTARLDDSRVDDAVITLTISVESSLTVGLRVMGPGDLTTVSTPFFVSSDTASLDIDVERIRNLGVGQVESRQTASSYYDALDPDAELDTLNKWLVYAGFATDNADSSVTMLDDALSGTSSSGQDFAHAQYTNNFDLGFGRDMYVRIDSSGNVYSFVTNYPNLTAAIAQEGDFVTVVMEYSPPAQTPGADPFVKFYVYAPNGDGQQVRINSMDFDGRGHKFVPGVCAACHAGKPSSIDVVTSVAPYPDLGDINATFLPWDLESLLYSDTDREIAALADVEPDPTLPRYTRAAQEEQFRKMNEAVYHTFVDAADVRFDPGLDLLRGWYSDSACDASIGGSKAACLSGTFTDGYVPSTWSAESNLYLDVYARHCRACHIPLQTPSLQFASAESFLSDENRQRVAELVFNTGTMPLARLTMDRLWTGSVDTAPSIALLRDKIPEAADAIPGQPLAVATGRQRAFSAVAKHSAADVDFLMTKTGRAVDVVSDASLFLQDVSWTLLNGTDHAGFESCETDPAALLSAGSMALILPSIAANYCLQMSGSNDHGESVSELVLVSAVENRLPQLLHTSNCASATDCPSVAEQNTQSIASERILSAISGSGTPTADTLLHIADPDVDDLLDAPSAISMQFDAPTTGVLKLRGTPVAAPIDLTLEEFTSGLVAYEATVDEVGASPIVESLSFDLSDTGVLTQAGNVVELRINPVNEGTPSFTGLDTVLTVEFSGPSRGTSRATSPTFQVNDADGDPITVTVSAQAGKGFVDVLDPRDEFVYEFTADSAEQVASAKGSSLCTAAGSFVSGDNRDSFTLAASDGAGPATTANVAVTLRPQTDYASVVSEIRDTSAGALQCDNCHLSAGPGPNWAFSYATLSGLVDVTANPNSSAIFTNGLAGSGHTGGTYSFSSFQRNLLRQWIFECAPQF